MTIINQKTNNLLAIIAIITIGFGFLSFRPIEDLDIDISEETSLYEEIVQMDKIYFDAYNTCDMETQASLYDEDIEFYHDKGGLATSKSELLESLEKNICGKVTRELVEGSIEVYPIANFGAVQIGMHKFFNNQEPDAISKPSKFITIWRKTEESYKISRVISLH